MEKLPIAFDLDKTLWHEPPGYEGSEEWDAPDRIARVVPDSLAIARAVALAHPIVFVSGRSEVVREAIQTRLNELGLPGALYLQQTWRGDSEMIGFKANVLRNTGAIVFVGDHASDAAAAERAGVAFVQAETWRDPGFPFWTPIVAPPPSSGYACG